MAYFDAERDGEIDLVPAASDDNQLVYRRNDTPATENRHPGIRLVDGSGNRQGIGAKMAAAKVPGTPVRELRSGDDSIPRDPFGVRVGLGDAAVANVTVPWPAGAAAFQSKIEVDRLLAIRCH